MIATRFPDLVSSLLVYSSLTKNDFPVPPWPSCYKDIKSLSNYTQHLALVLRKSIKHQIGQGNKSKGNKNEGEFTKLKTSKRYKWILALTAAFVQQDQIQREVSQWFTYLTDRTVVQLYSQEKKQQIPIFGYFRVFNEHP